MPFRQLVNLTSVSIAGPGDGTAPKAVKIFVNKPNLSFDNCNKKATETLDLTPEQVAGGARIELDFTQFQNIRCVSFFVDTNQGGGDVTNVSNRRQRRARAHHEHERAQKVLRRVKLRPTRGESFRSIDGARSQCAARRRYVARADDGAGSLASPAAAAKGPNRDDHSATAVTARRRNSPPGERAAPEIRRDERGDRRASLALALFFRSSTV